MFFQEAFSLGNGDLEKFWAGVERTGGDRLRGHPMCLKKCNLNTKPQAWTADSPTWSWCSEALGLQSNSGHQGWWSKAFATSTCACLGKDVWRRKEGGGAENDFCSQELGKASGFVGCSKHIPHLFRYKKRPWILEKNSPWLTNVCP